MRWGSGRAWARHLRPRPPRARPRIFEECFRWLLSYNKFTERGLCTVRTVGTTPTPLHGTRHLVHAQL